MKFKSWAASLAAVSLLIPAGGNAGASIPSPSGVHSLQHATSTTIAQRNAMITALQKHVKYVFVLYQENRSFDSYFGTFPNADGIYSQPAAQTLGFAQKIENVDGTFSTVSPFRIGPAQYAADTDDVDHSHPRLISKIDVTSSGPQMDAYAMVEEQKHIPTGQTLPTLQAKQYGELAMAHEDCNTVPLLWNYANRFVLFDHMFQSYLGPSTPGNLTIIGAQAGETQDALHPTESYTDNGSAAAGVPVMNDRDPAFGPYNPNDGANPSTVQINLTWATQPLTLAGPAITSVVASDPSSAVDFADVEDDVSLIAGKKSSAAWGWFQEGYDQEPGEPQGSSLATYVTHHNGPQYFGYVANSSERGNLHGLGDFMTAVSGGTLAAPGVYYVKGGFQNLLGLKPANPLAAVQTNFVGDDDHPGYSDAQISEAQVAQNINLIVKSKYWNQSAIIVTYDDSEGDYDHVAPPLRSIGPGVGNVPADYLSDGPRVPMIVVSPFAKDHTVEHAYGDQGSVVKFVNTVFGLTTLSALPDEMKARRAAEYAGKINYGPDDGDTNGITDLLGAFDPGRLNGTRAPLPASYAYVNPYLINTIPQKTGLGCGAIGVIPVDYLRGIRNTIPADFNPLPGTNPTQSDSKPVNTRRDVMRARDLDD